LNLFYSQRNFSLDDLVSYFLAKDNLAKEGKKVKEMNRVMEAF
jgi:hypothetical protein